MLVTLACLVLGTTACGPVKPVFAPAVAIQQLQVQTDGAWIMDIRLDNYSATAVTIENLALTMQVMDVLAGSVSNASAISISAVSAEVLRITLQPSAIARLSIANALANHGPCRYHLRAQIHLTASDHRHARTDLVDYHGLLYPSPGLPGVLR